MRNRHRCRFEPLERRECLSTVTVGPGQQYADLWQVPFNTMGPGTVVKVLWQPDPYFDKVDVWQDGIELMGVPNDQGQLPVLSGYDPTGAHQVNETIDAAYWFHAAAGDLSNDALVTVMPRDGATEHQPVGVTITGFEITGARALLPGRQVNGFISHDDLHYGQFRYWQEPAQGVGVWGATDLTVSGCVIHDNEGNGFFAKSWDDYWNRYTTTNLQFVHNTVYDNGVDNHHHNVYSEAFGSTYAYNSIGDTKSGSVGMKLRDDRPSVYCNVFFGYQNIQLDLVEMEDYQSVLQLDPNYGACYVYGNVFRNPDVASKQVLFGSDDAIPSVAQTTLYFSNNTLDWSSSHNYWDATAIKFIPGVTPIKAYIYDDVFAFSGVPENYYPFLLDGLDDRVTVYLGADLFPTNMSAYWYTSGYVAAGVTVDSGYAVVGNPEFVNEGTGDLRLSSPGSAAIDKGKGFYDGAFHDAGLPKPAYQLDPTAKAPTWIPRASWDNLGAIETEVAGDLGLSWARRKAPLDAAFAVGLE